MKCVVDSNRLRDEELAIVLGSSRENVAVLPDYAAMEALKGAPVIGMFESFEILSAARKSRNYIAHESGDLGEIHRASAKRLVEAIEKLKPHVENIARGDNITSAWAYAVSEREPAPSSMMRAYVGMVMAWVFKPSEFDSDANEA